MAVVSSAGAAAAAAAASAAIAANNSRVVQYQANCAEFIWIGACLVTLFGFVFSLLFWWMLKESDLSWEFRIIFWTLFILCVLFTFTLPAVFVMWLCGVSP